jgi:integrase
MARRPRGSGHVYRPRKRLRDGSTKELAVWWIAYYSSGRLIRESTGTSVKGEAERLLRARTLAVDQGTFVEPAARKTTLSDLRRLVENDYRNNRRRSLREVTRAFDRLQEHFGEACPAHTISSDRVEAYKAARLADAAPATVNRELAMLRRGFRLGVRLGRVAVRPDFSLLREDNVRRGFFELHQFEAVRQQLPDDLKTVATFLYWTGWRKSEALGLEWRHVDLKAGVLRIDTSKNGDPRTIPYGAVPALKELIEEQRRATAARELQAGAVIPWVFHRQGARIETFYGAWRGACAKAGLPGRLVHDFRRTAARNMMRAGIPQNVAMKIGGWKTDSVFRRYAIVDEALLAENMKKLAAIQPRA